MKIFLKKFKIKTSERIKKLKNVFSSRKKLFRSKTFLTISLLIFSFFVLFFFYSTIFASQWRIWPQKVRFSIALNRLAASVYQEPRCDFDCYLKREPYRQELLQGLKKPYLAQKISDIIFAEEENLNWRLELLNLVWRDEKLSERVLFSDLEEYLSRDEAHPKIKGLIAAYFSASPSSSAYLNELKNTIADEQASSEERLVALRVIKNIDQSLAPFYLDLIKKESNPEVLIELIRSLALDESRFDLEREALLLTFSGFFSNFSDSSTARRLAVFLLSDFIEEESSGPIFSFLNNLFFDSKTSDFDKYFLASSILAKFPDDEDLSKKYALREITDEEWLWYSEQK